MARAAADTWTWGNFIHTWVPPHVEVPASTNLGTAFTERSLLSPMVIATEGVLVTCDGALRQFILHLDEQRIQSDQPSFVISRDLDETHLLIKEDAIAFVQEKVEELQASNSFSRSLEPFAEARAQQEGNEGKGGKRRR